MKRIMIICGVILIFSISPSYAQKNKKGRQQAITVETDSMIGVLNDSITNLIKINDSIVFAKDESIRVLNDSVQNLNITINDLRNKLSTILTDKFMQDWKDRPFSKFDVHQFQKDTTSIYQITEFIPEEIKKLYTNYQTYEKGMSCINGKYNGHAIDSIIGPIRTIRDETIDTDKKKELADLATYLNDYKTAVEYFQDLIENVNTALKGSRVKGVIDLAFNDPENVDPDVVDFINSYAWLKQQLVAYKKELSTGGTTVQDEILHLLDPQ